MDHGDFRLYETQAMLRSMNRIAPSPPMVPTDEARIADALPRAQICVDVVAGSMGDQKFMAGDALSLADLMIVPHLAYFAQTEEGRAWCRRRLSGRWALSGTLPSPAAAGRILPTNGRLHDRSAA